MSDGNYTELLLEILGRLITFSFHTVEPAKTTQP